MRGLLALAAAAVLLSLLAAACGGGGGGHDVEPTLGTPLSLEAYFDGLAALDAAFAERSEEQAAQLATDRAGIASPEDTLNVARDYVGEAVFNVQQFIDGLMPLSPPPEAEEAHREVIQSGDRTMDAFSALPDEFDTLTSADDLDTLLADGSLESAQAALRQSCADLQAVADENGIDVELSCGV